MNEIVQIVQQKSGLSEEKSIEVVRAVVTYVKGKLPAGLSSHVDGLVGDLGGDTTGADTAEHESSGGLSSLVGGMFGKKDS